MIGGQALGWGTRWVWLSGAPRGSLGIDRRAPWLWCWLCWGQGFTLSGASRVSINQALTGSWFQTHVVDPSAVFHSSPAYSSPWEGRGEGRQVFAESAGSSASSEAVRREDRSLGRTCAFWGSPAQIHSTRPNSGQMRMQKSIWKGLWRALAPLLLSACVWRRLCRTHITWASAWGHCLLVVPVNPCFKQKWLDFSWPSGSGKLSDENPFLHLC